MPKPYRARNKRIIPRSANGRFRRATLADVGLSVCEKCGAIYTPDFSQARVGRFIDPMKLNEIKSWCPRCRGYGNDEMTGFEVTLNNDAAG